MSGLATVVIKTIKVYTVKNAISAKGKNHLVKIQSFKIWGLYIKKMIGLA